MSSFAYRYTTGGNIVHMSQVFSGDRDVIISLERHDPGERWPTVIDVALPARQVKKLRRALKQASLMLSEDGKGD